MASRSVHSHTAETLLLDWSNITAVALARLARACRRDGVQIPMLNKLADIGTEDYLNCYKGLKTIMRQGGILGQLTSLRDSLYTHCLLPSIVFRLIAGTPRLFRIRLGANKNDLRTFWTNLFSIPECIALRNLHPHLKNKTMNELSRMLPLRIHEDAGPFTKTKGMNLISWSSLLARGTELESKYHTISLRR